MKHCIALLLFAFVPAAAAGETESFWVGQGGAFNDPVNWNGPLPDETVTCIFDVRFKIGPFIMFDEDGLSSRAIIRTGFVFFNLWDTDPGGEQVSLNYDVVNPSFNTPSFIVAENAGENATLKISFGFLNTQSVILGMGAGSYGAIEFGAQGVFDLFPGLSCVYELHVGGSGQGVLTIDEGVVVTAGETVLGVATGSLGDVFVTNPDSRLDVAGPLTVGKQGQGTLTVDDLADLTSTSALIGMSPGSQGTVTITGQGATWINDGSLDVGYQGQGTLSVTGGAAVFTHGFAAIGTFPEPVFPPVTGGVGDVTVSGPASLWLVDGDLFVGLLWSGMLDILDGATVTSQAGIVGMAGPGGDVVNVEGPGSVWSTIEDITVFFGGLLRIADGAIVLASVVDVLPGAELEADGTIVADVDSNGTVRIGDVVGMLDVEGTFTTTGELLLDLGGTTPGSFDAVVVSDAASVGGSLTVSLVDGYVPRFGDAFGVLAAASIDGVFETLTLPVLDPGLVWHLDQDADSILLVVTSLGDLDGDGIVGINDFLLLLAAWGPCPAPPANCPADLDNDGIVGINDFLLLLSLWS